uniref:C2H2-type domain-containing protein n=1 Tax=Clytia hemisphaerica TaxID=252671 RepID=A0A7M5XBI5_9CNID
MKLINIIYMLWVSFSHTICGKTKNDNLKKKLFLLNLPFASAVNKERNCSLARSSLVRNLLLQEFNPIYKRYGVEVPRGCVFNLKQSMYNALEEKKLETSNGFWKCDACGKKFYTEEHIYKHFYSKHQDLIKH